MGRGWLPDIVSGVVGTPCVGEGFVREAGFDVDNFEGAVEWVVGVMRGAGVGGKKVQDPGVGRGAASLGYRGKRLVDVHAC